MRARRSLVSAVAVGGVALATVLVVTPNSTAAVQQVSITTTVNGVLNGSTYTGQATTAALPPSSSGRGKSSMSGVCTSA